MSGEKREYYPVIGLEIHAELATRTKMFCRCQNNPFDAEPNAHTCPVCMAHPGTLPVPNKEAIDQMVRIGLAVNGEIANFTEFDRKNYFYPDIPKAYQISQYKYPIVSGGSLAGVELTRIHLEEDTATSKHKGNHSLVDYNRAGVPLMELVTEPVIKSSEQAMTFAKELQLLLRYLGASHANMEKGEMRVEANISISPDPKQFGTKVEVKNLNSFNVVGRAIEYEIKRMTKLYEEGRADEIVQETRGWDDAKQKTFSQRKKESSEEYRYFPEPDIPKFYLHEVYNLDEVRRELPELPEEKRVRYRDEYGLKEEDVETFVTDNALSVLFENTVIHFNDDGDKRLKSITTAANYLTSDLLGYVKNEPEGRELIEGLLPDSFAKLIDMNTAGDINSRATKDLLLVLARDGGEPEVLAQKMGLVQQNDEESLKTLAGEIIAEFPDIVAEYKGGKETSIKFLMGQGMKKSQGSANPQMLEKILKDLMVQ